MDGNLKAEHMQPRNPTDELWLMDGRGFMVASGDYRDYLAGTVKSTDHEIIRNELDQPATRLA